ncbi:hypothetical protein KIV40_30620, partial [Vibrio sp. D173a]|nr:hypothetical protein [Vibrio sp. D173a]
MKKTILAVAIAAVSTGVVASDFEQPSWELSPENIGKITENVNGNTEIITDNGKSIVINGETGTIRINGEKTDYTVDNGQVIHRGTGEGVGSIRHDGKDHIYIERVEDGSHVAIRTGSDDQLILDNAFINRDDSPEWGADKPRPELPKDSDNVLPDRPEASEQIRDLVRNGKDIVGGEIDRIDGAIYDSSVRMDSLEQDLYKQGQKMLELDDRMDQVMASSHAITNARPVLANAGEYAVGV